LEQCNAHRKQKPIVKIYHMLLICSYPFISCIFVAPMNDFLTPNGGFCSFKPLPTSLEAGGTSGSFSNSLLDPEALDYDDAAGLFVGR